MRMKPEDGTKAMDGMMTDLRNSIRTIPRDGLEVPITEGGRGKRVEVAVTARKTAKGGVAYA